MRALFPAPSGVTLIWAMALALPATAQTPVQQVQLTPADTLRALSWHTLASDPQGDGLRPKLPDAKELAYAVDKKSGLVWFRVTLHEPPPERFFGINVSVDADADATNGLAWWGQNKVKLDRLASAYLFAAEGYWQGVAGVADADSARQSLFSSITTDTKAALDREQKAILLGVPRSALGTSNSVRIIATVGSMTANNDDVPNEGMVTVQLTP